VAAEVRTQTALSDRWYPIVFAEEAYEVGTPGEFWLTAVFHLSDQTQDPNLLRAYEDIRVEGDESRLRERALAELMDFADKQGKNLLLVVENLNMILGQQLSGRDGWVLRHTLQNESRLMMLGTAPLRFEEIEHVNKAWFELVTVYELKPLERPEIKVLWNSLTAEKLSNDRLRPIQILTGGNPRLISILASFAVHTSFRELMDNLIQLIDDHTEYFKGQLDGLAPLERKVFVTLLDLWDPSTASEVAAAARIGVSKASSFLGRLRNRGAVSIEESGRKKRYKATERLYNIYYLMRRRGQGHPSDRVHAVVTFMLQFYERDQLITMTKKLAEEACLLSPERRRDHFCAYEDIIRHLAKPDLLEMVGSTPSEFLTAPDAPHIVRELASIDGRQPLFSRVISFIKRGNDLLAKGEFDQAQVHLRRAVELQPDSFEAWEALGQCFHDQKRYTQARDAFTEVTKLRPNSAAAWASLGHLLGDHLHQLDEAKNAYTTAIELGSNLGWVWARLGQLLKDHTKQYRDAERALRKSLEIEPDEPWALAELGDLLSTRFSDRQEGEQMLRKAVELNPQDTWAWARLSRSQRILKKNDEAELTLRRAIELNPRAEDLLGELGHLYAEVERHNDAQRVFRKIADSNPAAEWAWSHLGDINKTLGNYEEAESDFRKALNLNATRAWTWTGLGDLYERLNRNAEAEQSYEKAVEVDPDSQPSLTRLVKFLIRLGKPEEASLVARQFAGRVKNDYSKLNSLAWLFYEQTQTKYLAEPELWARSALECAPLEEKWWVAHTLAAILGAQGKWEESLDVAPMFLDATADNESAVGDATDFIISAAANGNAKSALDLVLGSKGAGALEPLILGLKLFLGETEYKAPEIVEIGRDVAQRIRERQVRESVLDAAKNTTSH
jgi:tetratricopeptide (TPR) repeat protein